MLRLVIAAEAVLGRENTREGDVTRCVERVDDMSEGSGEYARRVHQRRDAQPVQRRPARAGQDLGADADDH